MDQQTLKAAIESRGCRVIIGAESRCYMSISCFTPQVAYLSPVVHVHPEVSSPAEVREALAIQLALIIRSSGVGQFRMNDSRDPRWLRKAWHHAAYIVAPAKEWDQAVAEGLSEVEMKDRFGMTERLLRIRGNVWAARRGDLGPILADDGLYSLTYRPIADNAGAAEREGAIAAMAM